jgi:putative transposase
MVHPYPPHMENFSYVGKYRYFLTFTTHDRKTYFTNAETVQLVYAQILRAAHQHQFSIVAYCFMPDHLHILADGVSDGSDLRIFMKAAKQYSGYHFKQQHQAKLWQRYGYEHTLRDDVERATTLRYILDNPVGAGLVKEPADYAFLGSDCYSVAELLEQAAPRG